MNKVLQFLLIIMVSWQINAQSNSNARIIASNLGSAGSSKMVETSQGRYYISQSVGQSSVIGTHHANGYYLRQGYQQPLDKLGRITKLDIELKAKVYPNPFSRNLFITFSDRMINDISVRIFDVNARIILNQSYLPTQQLELQLQDISSGSYFLNVSSGSKKFRTKLIKL